MGKACGVGKGLGLGRFKRGDMRVVICGICNVFKWLWFFAGSHEFWAIRGANGCSGARA